jgi:hypothetical protein
MTDKPSSDHQAPNDDAKPKTKDELVDYISEQSFPGSDAPPYYGGKEDKHPEPVEPDQSEGNKDGSRVDDL